MPTWCFVVAVLWPVVFLSLMLHSFAIGGDAFNGKVEAGRYYLWKAFRSDADTTPYMEASKARYTANYIHAVTTMILVVPALVAMWRIVSPAIEQVRGGHVQTKR